MSWTFLPSVYARACLERKYQRVEKFEKNVIRDCRGFRVPGNRTSGFLRPRLSHTQHTPGIHPAYTRHTPGIHPAYTRYTPVTHPATPGRSAALPGPFPGCSWAGDVPPGARKRVLRVRARVHSPGKDHAGGPGARRAHAGCMPGVCRVYAGCTPGVYRVYAGCMRGMRHQEKDDRHASWGPRNTPGARFSCPDARRARPAATWGLWWAAEVHANAPEIT